MKMSTSDLTEKIELAATKAPVGSIWMHYKGGCYIVTGHSVETENMNTLIHYRRIGGSDFNAIDEAKIVFARPVLDWFQTVRIPDGDLYFVVARFNRVS